MLEIDHVIFVVTDLEGAGRELLARHGLASVPGGRHTGHGTGNQIVPLGNAYLELMAVIDETEAASSPMGRWALQRRREDLVPTAICLRTDDIDGVARTLGETPIVMTRVREDGVTLAWRLAGLDGMLGSQTLPFFIQWEVAPADHPGAAAAPHRVSTAGIAAVTIGPVTPEIATLIAGVPGLRVGDGAPGVHAVTVATEAGEVVLAG